MTDQRRGVREESPAPGYRGALPPRADTLARPWVITVLVIFILIIVLAVFNVPSTLLPESSPTPIPAISVEPSASGSAAPSTSASAAASTASAGQSPSSSP